MTEWGLIGRKNAISLYVTKALDTPGVVCARVVNGLNHAFRTERLPRSGQSAPPGRYRVCFSSESVPPEGLQATICSAEFTLPSERKGLSTAGGRTVLRLGAMRKKHYEWLSIGADVGRLRIEP